MTFQPDKSQLKAIQTWNGGNNPTRHAVIKLAGEAGEILDLYGKHEYKPEFDWWNCKHCGKMENCGKLNNNCPNYTPLVLDELGDFSYYLRILCWQKEVSFEEICRGISLDGIQDDTLLEWLTELTLDSSRLLDGYVNGNDIWIRYLRDCVTDFLAILSKLDTTLEQVLDLNYKKLNSEPTNHGWQDAR